MAGVTESQRERARRMLAREAAVERAEPAGPTAAARVYDKLHAYLAPLVGIAGVELLLVRSARLAGGAFEGVAPAAMLHGAVRLRERLASREPALDAESAVALFSTFLALITTFIGERLTLQLLRSVWPDLEDPILLEKPHE